MLSLLNDINNLDEEYKNLLNDIISLEQYLLYLIYLCF